jgi:hypothetical protein
VIEIRQDQGRCEADPCRLAWQPETEPRTMTVEVDTDYPSVQLFVCACGASMVDVERVE